MKNHPEANIRHLRLFICANILLTILGIVMRIANLFFFYDKEIGYYSAGAPLPVIMNIFFLISCVLFAAGAFFVAKQPFATEGTESNIPVKIVSGICALVFAVLAFDTILSFIWETSISSLIITIALVFSTLYFVLNFIKKRYEAQALAAIAVEVVLVYIVAVSYFDIYTQMNSPNKILLQLALISSMLFFISEARCITGNMRKRIYVFSLSSALFFSGVSSIPSLIALFGGKLADHPYFSYDVLLLVLFIYFWVRLIVLFVTADKEKLPQTPCETAIEANDCASEVQPLTEEELEKENASLDDLFSESDTEEKRSEE